MLNSPRTLYLFIALSLLPGISIAQTNLSKVNGYCQQGNQTVLVNGVRSSTTTSVMRSYPQCTVTVYVSGTATLAAVYSDANGTPKSNPFTADTTAAYSFYTTDGLYDITISGSSLPSLTQAGTGVISPLFHTNTLQSALASLPISPISFLPSNTPNIGDGNSHPVSVLYNTCAKANAAYSFIPASGCDLSLELTYIGAQAAYLWITGGSGPGAGIVRFPAGTFVTSKRWDWTAPIALEGFGSGITTIKPKSGVDTGIISYMGCGTVESPNCGGSVAFLSMNGAGVRRLRILGDGNTTTPGTQTKAAIYTAYAYLGRWDDVKIEFWGGYGMYWRSTFDHDINASFMRWTGSGVGGRESWFFDNDLGGSGVYPVNELRVVNSDFEGDINAFVKSVGLNNNSIGFVNTKFETTNLNTTYTPIVINTAAQSNWTFSACRFNGYWSAPAFLSASLLNGAYIQGVNFNSGSPTAFATLTDSSAISINVRGFNPGQVTQSGNSQYNAISSVDEFSQGSSTYLMNTPEFRSLNLREVGGYKIANDAGATQGYAIQGQSTDNTFQVNIPINQTTQTKNGITVYFKMKSSSAKGYKIQVNNFGASVSQDITPVSVTTSYAWYQGSIPHQYMTANTAGPTYVGIVSTTGQAGITLSISDIYYENKYFTGGSACPDSDGTSYTWTLGDIVYWPQSTPAAGLPTACVATASGSPGTWRTFGLIDMLNTALTFNGAVAFSQNTVFNAGLSSISAPGTFNLIASGHTGATSGTNISCGLQAQNDNLNVKYICTDGSSTRVPWGTDWTNSIWFSAQLLQSQQGIEFTPVLVANLGTPTRSGVRKFVSNASTTVAAGVGTIVAGGGTNIVPVYWDGTNWRIG